MRDLKEMSDWEDVWGKNVPGKGRARAEARAGLAYQQEKRCGWSELGRGTVTVPEADGKQITSDPITSSEDFGFDAERREDPSRVPGEK